MHRWSLEMVKLFNPTLHWACDYLSTLSLRLNHVSKRGPSSTNLMVPDLQRSCDLTTNMYAVSNLLLLVFICQCLISPTLSRWRWSCPGVHGYINHINTLRPRQNGRHFADDIFKRFFLNENVWVSIKISLKFVPKGSISNIPALVPIMAWRRPGDKPLSESRMESLLTHMCVTRPQWVNLLRTMV